MAPNSPTNSFPLYLLPSTPFRRRSSTPSTSTLSSSPSTPPTPTSYLTRTPTAHLRCNKCLADLIPTSCIISKGFTGRHGRAYLVAPPPPQSLLDTDSGSGPGPGSTSTAQPDLPNTLTHKPVARQLVTGAHTVSDISCRTCGSVLGWKYVHAEEEGQRYKVGKYILETRRVVRCGLAWEAGEMEDVGAKGASGECGDEDEDGRGEGEEEVQFDSQDEDECEDLFSGMWSPGLAGRRRRNRDFRRS